MGAIHRLITEKGKAGALREVLDRRVVEAAVEYMSAEQPGIGFAFDGWAQVGLPHRRLPDDAAWQIRSGKATLTVEPGRRRGPGGRTEFVGVPYGSRARLLILYLQSEALRTGSREIELGSALQAWLDRMGMPLGGKSARDLRDQVERVLRCRITFEVADQRCYGLIHQHVVDAATFETTDDRTAAATLDRVLLCETFFRRLLRSPVAIEPAAIRAISNNSMAIDIYIWLSHYLPRLRSDRLMSWADLRTQFGTRFARADHFRMRFSENLALATAVLRDVDVETRLDGVLLRAGIAA